MLLKAIVFNKYMTPNLSDFVKQFQSLIDEHGDISALRVYEQHNNSNIVFETVFSGTREFKQVVQITGICGDIQEAAEAINYSLAQSPDYQGAHFGTLVLSTSNRAIGVCILRQAQSKANTNDTGPKEEIRHQDKGQAAKPKRQSKQSV